MFRYDKFFVLPGSNKVCFKHRVRGGTQQHTFCSLVYRHPGFFSFQHCAKIIALIGAARSVVQFYCTMKRMRNCAKQVKKTVRIKTVYFFLRTLRSNFFNFLIQRINLISQIKSRMDASGEFLTFKRR